MNVNEELNFGKIHKKKFLWGGGGGLGGQWEGSGCGVGGQGGCERRIEVFVKIQKKKFFFLGGGGGGDRVGVGLWGQSGYERRIGSFL